MNVYLNVDHLSSRCPCVSTDRLIDIKSIIPRYNEIRGTLRWLPTKHKIDSLHNEIRSIKETSESGICWRICDVFWRVHKSESMYLRLTPTANDL